MMSESQSREKFEKSLSLLRAKQFEQAELICKSVLAQQPDDVNFLGLMGTMKMLSGATHESIDLLRRAVKLEPEFARAHFDLGKAFVIANDHQSAISHFQRTLEIEPENEFAHYALANSLVQTGQGKEADEVLEKAFLLNPARGTLAKAGELFQQGSYRKAEKLTREILKDDPDNIDAMRMMAKLALQANLFAEAEVTLAKIIEQVPSLHECYLDMTRALREQDKFDEAIKYASQAIKLRPDHFQSYMVMASLLAAGSRTHEAINAYRACLELRKNNPNVYLGYGHVLKTAGQIDEGIDAYKDAIRIRADNGEAYWSLANLKTYHFTDKEIADMQAILEDTSIEKENRVHFLFSLAKAFEDRTEYDKAFGYYQEANEIQRMLISYDPVQTEVLHEQIKNTFTGAFIESKKGLGNPAPAPIFIVGLPRSGSTLIEQILSSHSQVDGTSELPDLSKVVMSLNRQAAGKGYPAGVVDLEDEEFQQLGSMYIESTRRVRKQAPFFTDKMPNNFPTIGFLSLILPNAKIINARRNPIDSCIGCYKQHFARGQTFTYDLQELGEFYVEYHELMKYWHKVLPGKILDVNYEDMVADQETQTRRLLDYCGLEFEQACLSFYETDRPVRTASSEQVRQPIYQSSLDTWKRFEDHIQPLLEILQPVLEE